MSAWGGPGSVLLMGWQLQTEEEGGEVWERGLAPGPAAVAVDWDAVVEDWRFCCFRCGGIVLCG